MIFGSKALTVAVLGALVFSDEASAAKLKKGNRNKGLRKAQRELKGGKGKGKGMNDVDTRADADEETVEDIIDAVIENKADGGDAIGDEIEPDAMPNCSDPVGITFGTSMAQCKYQYTANAPKRFCEYALQCTETSDITQLTFKYTSVPSADPSCDPNGPIYCPNEDKAEGGRVWIVENVDEFELKLKNVPAPITYEYLTWMVNNDLDTATPKGKTLYNQDVWVGDEFSINISPSTLSKDELAYFAFDKDGNLITFAIFDTDCYTAPYRIGDKLGNSMISSFRSTEFGIVSSTVFIDSYKYTVQNHCDGDDPAAVYSLDRTFCTSSCGEDKWECPTAEGYNPFSCVVDGKTQLGCSGSTTILPNSPSEPFTDSIDGKGPIDLLETKIRLNVNAVIKYSEFWTMESTPEGGVTSPVIDASGCM